MAVVENKYCPKCEKVEYFCNGTCNSCRSDKYIQETAAWNALSVDQRLQDLRRRIEKLEQGPPTY